MKIIEGYEHQVGSHCESGTTRNLLKFTGLDISEALIFGIGKGVCFAYLTNIKSVAGFPLTAVRLPMGEIITSIKKFCNIDFFIHKFKKTDDAIKKLNDLIDSGQPASACVDMFYMKYLPKFMQIHVPFHFITIIGRDKNKYAVSDPYFQEIGEITLEQLRLAWETHALFSEDNLLAYVKSVPAEIDWKKAIKNGISVTCRNMVLPPVIRNIFSRYGVDGIKLFANSIPKWPDRHSGLELREGILFTPTILEEQGTGGGAFRMLYAAFLQEAAEIFNSDDMRAIAKRMTINGEKWRDASRELLKAGKVIPMNPREYQEWYKDNSTKLKDKLTTISNLFIERACEEKEIFIELKKLINNLK